MNLLPNGSSEVTFAFGSSHERRRIGEFLRPHLSGPVAKGKFFIGAVVPGYSDVIVPVSVLPEVAEVINQRGLEAMRGVFNGDQPSDKLIPASHALVELYKYIDQQRHL